MQLQLVKTKDLKNNTGQILGLPKNPRILKDDKFIKLKKSLEDDPEMLELREVIAYDNNGEMVVICGNMRLKALKELGVTEIPTKILPSSTSVEKLKAYTIKDNVSFGEHDWDQLANEWDADELNEWGLDVPVFDSEVLEAEEDDFDTTPPSEPITVLGDLYEIGEHRLLCGDSTDSDQVAKLMNGQKADMVFTDPPYGVDYEGINNDDRGGLENLLRGAFGNMMLSTNNGGSFYCFHSDKCSDIFSKVYREFCHFSSMIIWVKESIVLSQTDYQSKHEPCMYGWFDNGTHKWYSDRKQESVWIAKSKKEEGHTTPKPIEIITKALNNSSKTGMSVLDLFLGSGSTMVASHQLKRKCYGMELDPKYCDVIVKRMVKLDPTLVIKRNGVVTNDFE
jgi:site-specific DNA-methyltransferase (adenine-specific)